ncbi:hypothetical protein KAS08_01130 [Candidatus Pacearchaeota archaeon]|nr:hypothetical protein [Candidatus Pacearchaeota archaeon]
METLEDEVLGFEETPKGIRVINFSEYFKTKFNLNLEDLQNPSEIELIRVNLRLSLDQTNFLHYAIRNNYWKAKSSVNMVYMENEKVIQTNPGPHIQHELIENQLNSHYMKKCPNEWLENCLAYNADRKIGELKNKLFPKKQFIYSSNSSNNI